MGLCNGPCEWERRVEREKHGFFIVVGVERMWREITLKVHADKTARNSNKRLPSSETKNC